MPKDPKENGALDEILSWGFTEYFDTLNATMPEVKPDSDYKEQVDFVGKLNKGRSVATRAMKVVREALQALPQEKLDAFYNRVVDKDKREKFPPRKMTTVTTPWLFDESVTGTPWMQAVKALDDALDGDTREKATEKLWDMYREERFPWNDEPQRLQDGKIQELKSQLPEGPDKEKDLKLLDEVNDILSIPTPDMAAYLNGMFAVPIKADSETLPGLPKNRKSIRGMEDFTAYANAAAEERYFQEHSQDARCFKVSTLSDCHEKKYEPDDISPYRGEQPTEEELRKYAGARTNVSGTTLDVVKKADKLFYEAYPQVDPDMLNPNFPDTLVGESGTKDYGFTPLVKANRELEKAVQDGDMEKIRQSREKYGALKTKVDAIMDAVKPKEGQMGLCGGNVDSTRGTDNRVPIEYQKDFVTHSRLNGLYALHNLSQVSKRPIEELVKEPGKVATELYAKHSAENGLRRKGTVGERLIGALDNNGSMEFTQAWNYGNSICLQRGLEAVAGMASSPQERAEIAGASKMASAGASYELHREVDAWEEVTKRSEGRKMLVQAAILNSDDQFNVLDLAIDYKKNHTSLDALCDKKAADGLDYGGIVDRMEEVDESMKDAYKELKRKRAAYNQTPSMSMDERERQMAFMELGQELMERASEKDKQTPGYQRLEKKTNSIVMALGGRDALDKVSTALGALTPPKKGRFLSSKNSVEHQNMTRTQEAVRLKLAMMNGQEPPNLSPEQRKRIGEASLADLVRDAKNCTFEYIRLKSDNGRKKTMLHEAGQVRFDAAINALESLETLSENLDLASPAERMRDEARRTMLQNPGNEKVLKESAAKIFIAQAMMDHPEVYPPDKQAENLTPFKLVRSVDAVCKSEEFNRFLNSTGAGKAEEQLLQNPAKLYRNYVKSFAPQEAARAPQEAAPQRARAARRQAQPDAPVAGQ